jgi:uncharacterized protein YfdQ (DUF2303 family)
MDDLDNASVELLIQTGRNSAGPQQVTGGNIPYVLVAEGYKAQALPELIYNEHNARPERIKAAVSLLDAASFIGYYNLFSDENSRVFAWEPEIKITAVLDYHGAHEGAPRWGAHKAVLTLRQSEEWKIWTANSNKQFTQQGFAEFLEQHSLDISSPTPAGMMEIARDLQATTEVDFGSSQRMQDGQVRFKYTESTKTTVGGSDITVPERFTLNIPAFIGSEDTKLEALLRFRIKDQKLVIWYTLVRPEEVIRTAFLICRNQIEQALGITILNGSVQA